MNYVTSASASKRDKKGNTHAEYEYIGAGGYLPHGGDHPPPKSVKKHDGHTYGPTHFVVPTHHPTPPKGSKKGCYYGDETTISPTHVGKGKGKGKGSKKGPAAPSMKGCKSSKSSKRGSYVPSTVPYPTEAPAESGSGDYGRPRPPTPVSAPTSIPPAVSPTTGPPAVPPGTFTASPTDEGSIAIDLEPYTLLYMTTTKRQATRAALAELTDATRLYLEEFMFDEFAGSSFTFLDDFITRMVTSTYLSGDAPYVVDYSSTARFSPFSSVTPSAEQLNEALVIAFTGDNLAAYNSRLEDLSSDNVFQGAAAYLDQPGDQVTRAKPSNNSATIAAAAVAATILAAGLIIYRRRMANEELTDKDLDKGRSDSTVAGETFSGETYEGSASASVASLEHTSRYKDCDGDLRHAPTLGTIEEDDDDNSVRPTWGANLSYDEWESEKHLDNQGSFDSNSSPQSELNSISTKSTNTDDRTLRRVNTEGSSVAASTVPQGITSSQSFDEMALQGFKRANERAENGKSVETSLSSETPENSSGDSQDMAAAAKTEEKSLLLANELREVPLERTMSSSSNRSRRPRTVEEIEAMLSADDDEESQGLASLSRSFSHSKSESWPARPRTVEEIESLLSAGLDDDHNDDSI